MVFLQTVKCTHRVIAITEPPARTHANEKGTAFHAMAEAVVMKKLATLLAVIVRNYR